MHFDLNQKIRPGWYFTVALWWLTQPFVNALMGFIDELLGITSQVVQNFLFIVWQYGIPIVLISFGIWLLLQPRLSKDAKMWPVIGMSISVVCFIGFAVWYFVENYKQQSKTQITETLSPKPEIPKAIILTQPQAKSEIKPKEKEMSQNKLITGKDTVVIGNVSGSVGDRSVVIGATDNHGNTIINQPNTAIGSNAYAGPGGISIGANAGAAGKPKVSNDDNASTKK